VKRQPSLRPRKRRPKREAPKPLPSTQAKEHGSTDKVSETRVTLLQLVRQLQRRTLDDDSNTSKLAFQALTGTFREMLSWLHFSALAPLSLGALLRRFPENDAWARYDRGEHPAAWAGVELARLYRQMQTELRSRSKRSVNRLRDIRCGFRLGKYVVPPNEWFCAEYERKVDYRPTGNMAAWAARKVEELRQLKNTRSEWRQYASIEIVAGRLRLLSKSQTDDVLAERFRSDTVEGEALKRLDNLPLFGSPNVESLKD